MDRLNLCLEPVERDIVAQQRKGRRDRLEGDDARTLRVARREQAVESLIGADIDESEGAVLRREETGPIAAIGRGAAILDGPVAPVGAPLPAIARRPDVPRARQG